jgi:hypothetical protein
MPKTPNIVKSKMNATERHERGKEFMNTTKISCRSAFTLGTALVATAWSVGTANASLTGTVNFQLDTTATESGSSYAFSFANGDAKNITASGGLASMSPTLTASPTVTFPGGSSLVLNQDSTHPTLFTSASDFTIDFGTRTLPDGAKGDLTFVLNHGATFEFTVLSEQTITVLGTPIATVKVDQFLMKQVGSIGQWVLTGPPGPNGHVSANGYVVLVGSGVAPGAGNPTSYIGAATLGITAVPEPATYLSGLGSVALLGLFFIRRRK